MFPQDETFSENPTHSHPELVEGWHPPYETHILRRNGRYDLVTLDMGFTLVAIHSGLDAYVAEMLIDAGIPTTLVDVRAAQARFWEAWLPEDAVRVWEPSLEADRAWSLEIDRRILGYLGVTDPTLVRRVNVRSNELFNDLATYTVYPEAFEALAALRRIVPRLGILSNWGWRLPELCERLGFNPYFDFIITSARVGATKPNPRIFHAALAQGQSEPGRTLHVGDSLSADVRGAQAVGIAGVLIDRTDTIQADGYPVVRSLTGVLDLL